jgi:hypothetical protein
VLTRLIGVRRPIVVLLTLLCSACSSSPAPSPSPSTQVVAQLGSATITSDIFQLRLQHSLATLAQAGGPTNNTAMTSRVRASVLRSLIIDTVIAQQAAAAGVSPTDAEIQVQIDATATAAGGAAKLQSQLAALGGSMAQLRDQVASSLTEQKLEDAFAHQRAGEIAQKLAAGTAFAGLAAQYSDDKDSSAKGGELGALARTTIQSGDPVFAAAVLALKPGQRTDPPIHDAQGYDIVQLESATASALTLRHIIVYAPTPYTVKERPQWFSAAIFETLAGECAAQQLHVYINDVGGDPCAAASASPSPSLAVPTSSP